MRVTMPSFLTADASPEQRIGQRSSMLEYDQSLVWVTTLLLLLGMVMVYSASVSLPDSPKYAGYKNHHFLARQAAFIAIGLIAGLLAFRVRIEQWERWTPWLFIGALILLALVQIPGLGKGVNGAKRWIGVGGLSMQPSEVMKLMMVFYAADFTVRKQQYMHSLSKGFFPMAVAVGMCGGLLMLQPDLGAFGVIVCIAMGVLFLGGFNIIWFAGMIGVLSAVFGAIVLISPWRYERMVAYLNPWNPANALGKAFQLTHSLIAFGRGELFGVGLGASRQKWGNLSQAHTDFIFSVIGEELGLFGTLSTLALLSVLLFSIFKIALRAKDPMVRYVSSGIGCWIAIQTILNIGSTLSVIPVVGVTLPLVSYGGSALIATYMGIGFVIGAARRDPAIFDELKKSEFTWLR